MKPESKQRRLYYLLVDKSHLDQVRALLTVLRTVYDLPCCPVISRNTGRQIDSTPERVVLEIETDHPRNHIESLPGVIRCRTHLKSREAYMKVEAE